MFNLSDMSGLCRGKSPQANTWYPNIKFYASPILQILPVPRRGAIIEYSDSLELSASDISLQSEYSDGVWGHTIAFVVYNSSPGTVEWVNDFALGLRGYNEFDPVAIVLENSDGPQLLAADVKFNFSCTTSMSAEGQMVSVSVDMMSSYPLISLVPYVPPVPPVTYLHIEGCLDKSKLSGRGGFTINGTAYYYDLIETDSDGYFDIEIEEPFTLHNFSCEWAYVGQSPLLSIDLSDFTGHNDVTDLSAAFKGNANLEYVRIPDMPAVTTYEECFSGCSSLADIDMTSDFSNVVSFAKMFRECSSLPRFSFGTVNIDTDPDCSQMFLDCTSLEEVDFGKLRTVGNIDSMFDGCTSLMNVVLTSKTWAPTSANRTFYGCTGLSSLYLWNMDPSFGTPGDYDSVNFFPTVASGLTVEFPSSHACGYDIRNLNFSSVDSYIRTLAQISSSFAGDHDMVVLTSAQYSYIQSIPSLLDAYNASRYTQGWQYSFA